MIKLAGRRIEVDVDVTDLVKVEQNLSDLVGRSSPL